MSLSCYTVSTVSTLEKSMADLEHRRTMLTSAIVGPNASYDSAIDSLPDECYCELASSPLVSFAHSPFYSVSHHNHHLQQHSALSSLPAAASSSSPSASLSLKDGPILLDNSNSNLSCFNHPSAQSPLYRSLADYHRLYNNGHTARQSASTSDSLHLSANIGKYASRSPPAIDSPMLTTNMAVFSGHSGSALRSNYRTTTGALSATTFGNSSAWLSDSCPSTFCAGTSAAPAVLSVRRVATGTDSRSSSNNHNSNNNSISNHRISGSEQEQLKKKKTTEKQPQPPGALVSAAKDTEDCAPHVHLRPACECSLRTDRQQVCSVHSATTDRTTTTSKSSNGSTATTAATLSASSLLRSSRSFTTSYRQRPNVTLIRRKSASERLAESRSKYIRSDLVEGERTIEDSEKSPAKGADCCHLCVQWTSEDEVAATDGGAASSNPTGNGNCTMRLLRTTPTSTKSSHTSSCRLSPISDHVCGQGQTQSGNLVDRINDQLNKSKQYNVSSFQKKRVSPRNSEGSATLSNGMSQLEMKLRELIIIDNSSSDHLPAPQSLAADQQCRATRDSAPSPEVAASAGYESNRQLQQEREAHHIYRAELKFIGSSNSSLSSMYSEPNHESLSPIDGSQFPHLLICDPVAPSAGEDANLVGIGGGKQTVQPLVIRSKSDVSPEKQQQLTERYRGCRTERLFGSIDSNLYQSTQERDLSGENSMGGNHKSSGGSPNLQIGHSLGSPSQESLCKREKDSVDMTIVQRLVPSKPARLPLLSAAKSCSINELSSCESSQLSVSEHLFKSALNHSKSTSKLTFENLMMHQQNLASSRSCHNLVASLQSGPSVVERNARIIKWLFNCRKAMTQTQLHPRHTADVVFS